MKRRGSRATRRGSAVLGGALLAATLGCDAAPPARPGDGGFVDPGPFQFSSCTYEIYVSGLGVGPGETTRSIIHADGAVDGCDHAPAAVLAAFVATATSPEMVAPFLVNTTCRITADASFEVTLTLANRTTYKRSITCDPRIPQLIDAAVPVFNAACPRPDAGVDSTSQ